ncbi:hypothetical protein GCM10011325_14450 [Dyadobacter sediminis]|nr:hypothetical protein GCM10011325_14450 [Dyadobacter sediminis]
MQAANGYSILKSHVVEVEERTAFGNMDRCQGVKTGFRECHFNACKTDRNVAKLTALNNILLC